MSDLAWSLLHMRGYSRYYIGQSSHQYSSVVMIVHELFCPHIVYNDLGYGHFLVMEVRYFKVLVWLVGIYSPNNANQHSELWSSMYPRLSMGRVGLLMVNLICVSMHHNVLHNSHWWILLINLRQIDINGFEVKCM